MTINEIQDLIKFIAKAGVTEVEIEKKDFKITIKSEMPKKKKGFGEAEATIQVPVAMAAGMAPVAPADHGRSSGSGVRSAKCQRQRTKQLHHCKISNDRDLLPKTIPGQGGLC